MSQKALDKVLNTVEITKSCWNWKGAIGSHGYGVLTFNKKHYTAHRFSYSLFNGDPSGKFVCHKCDNRKCVNPSHLFLGTNQENIDDAKSKGRKLGRSTQKEEVIALFNDGISYKEIAKELKISVKTVYRHINKYRKLNESEQI